MAVKKIKGQEPIIKDFYGALVLMADKVEEYLDLIFSTSIEREKFHRIELSDIPKKVLREVIINAIVHRNYEIDGARIMVDVYDDRVEVSSPGIPKFPMEKFYEFSVPSVSPNQKITFIFNQMHLVEERGLGMKELKTLKAAGNPADFKIENDFFITVIYRKEKATKKKESVADKKLAALKDEELKGYQYLQTQKRVSKNQYAENFKMDEKKAQRHLSKFKELKLVKQEGKGPSTLYVLIEKK